MRAAAHEHQVLRPVILPVAVDMMDDLVRMQPTPKQTFHDQPRALEVAISAPASIALSGTDIGQHISSGIHYFTPTVSEHKRSEATQTSVRPRTHRLPTFGALSQVLQIPRVAVRLGAHVASEFVAITGTTQTRAGLLGLAAGWAVGARNMVLPSVPDGIPRVTADADRARRQLRRSTGANIMRVFATAATDFLRERTSRAAALGAGAKLHALSLLQTRQERNLGGVS